MADWKQIEKDAIMEEIIKGRLETYPDSTPCNWDGSLVDPEEFWGVNEVPEWEKKLLKKIDYEIDNPMDGREILDKGEIIIEWEENINTLGLLVLCNNTYYLIRTDMSGEVVDVDKISQSEASEIIDEVNEEANIDYPEDDGYDSDRE